MSKVNILSWKQLAGVIALSLIVNVNLIAEEVYINNNAKIYKVDSETCVATFVCDLPYTPQDIAITPNGRIFCSGGGLGIKEIDITTGDTTDVGNLTNGGNSLVALNDTFLFFFSQGYICSLNILTGDSASVGQIPYSPNGDWCFYGNDLYMSSANFIARVDFDDTYTSILSVTKINPPSVSNFSFMALATVKNQEDCYDLLGFINAQVYTISYVIGQQSYKCNLSDLSINNVTGAASKTVFFTPCEPEFTMPNIFTPNGDALNDVFRPIEVSAIMSSNLSVFNRWGNLIFSSSDVLTGWDGEDYDTGVYYWVVDYITDKQETRSLKGYVSLLR